MARVGNCSLSPSMISANRRLRLASEEETALAGNGPGTVDLDQPFLAAQGTQRGRMESLRWQKPDAGAGVVPRQSGGGLPAK
jgi:hypothetical protein